MVLCQRDIVEINFRLPGDELKLHPVIIISNNTVNEYENYGIGVMLSSTPETDDYSFWLNDKMLTKATKKKTQVRCHLISMVLPEDVKCCHGQIRQEPFNKLLQLICSVTF